MCGIAGMHLPPAANPRRLAAIEWMTAILNHRGPDGHGSWVDRGGMIALGHHRLAVFDLSGASAQPMLSSDERLVISFNGAVYNFADLRPALTAKGYSLGGNCDTEVMLAAFESYGIEDALKAFSGMVATDNHLLHVIRDRMGKKPLYVALAMVRIMALSVESINVGEPIHDQIGDRTKLSRATKHDLSCGLSITMSSNCVT